MTEVIDIIQLIENNPLSKLTKPYQNRLINKVKDTFTTDNQKLFVSSFYCYLNYKKDDFVVDLDNIWKWLGFSTKQKSKELLENYFELDKDFKIVFSQKVKNSKGGRPRDQILMTIKTFKKMCMKANTKKSNDIHEYYIKLEETLHEVIDEESSELRKDLQFKDYLLEKSKLETIKLKSQMEKKKREKYKLSNSVYIISNPSLKTKTKNKKKYFKLGKIGDRNGRLENYGSGAPLDYKIEYSRLLCSKREESAIEGLMLVIFDNYRVINEISSKREWLSSIELDVLKKELDILVDFLESRKKFHETELPLINDDINDDINNDINNDVNNDINNDINDDGIINYSVNDDKIVNSINSESDQDLDDINSNVEDTDEDVITPLSLPVESIVEVAEEIIIDPRDFDKFVEDCCIVDKDNSEHFTPKSEIREAHRIWGNCTLREVKKEFENYLMINFQSSTSFMGDSRRNVYRGIKLKELTFIPSSKNLDYEKFIMTRCVVNYHNRISYGSFYDNFEKFKQETELDYKLTKEYKKQVKEYLNSKFLAGRVYISSVEKSIGLHGVYGLGIEENNFGIKIRPRKNKQVCQYDSTTNQLLDTFDSVILASKMLGIPCSSLGNYIRFGNVINNKIYKFIENIAKV